MTGTVIRVDPVTKTLGNFGKWQLTAMLIIFLCKLPTSWFMAVIIFSSPAAKPGDFWCTPPAELASNYTEEWIDYAHPAHYNRRDERVVDYCKVYSELMQRPFDYFRPNVTEIDTSELTPVKCHHFSFNPDFHSMVADFGLVCDRNYLVALSQCFHILGLMVGGIVAHFMLKTISPRNVMVIGVSAQIIFGNLISVVWSIEAHIVLRALTAAACALMYTSGSMIFSDITSGAAKTIALLVFEFFWSFGLIVLPIFDLFIEEWWKLYVAISMPTICLIFLIRYLPDSPRWMLRKGRIEEAKQILIEGATKNKRRVSINIDDVLQSEYNTGAAIPKEANWLELWDGRPATIFILAAHFAWSFYVLNFNCVVLGIRMYGRDHLSINTAAIGFSEIVGVFFGMYFVLYTSRRWMWAGLSCIICGLLGYPTWLIPHTMKHSQIVALEMAPTLAIKAATSVGMCVLTVCTADLVSADRKKMLMFSSTVWARAWFNWAPFIFLLKQFDPILPLTIFATLSIFGGICMLVIHQNQYKVYLENCEQRIETMKAVRKISNAGLDWIKNVRRSSTYEVEETQRKSTPETHSTDLRRMSICEQEEPSASIQQELSDSKQE